MAILKAALIGRSLAHSISPEVHRAVFPYVCSNWMRRSYRTIDYRLIECADEAAVLDTLRHAVVQGLCGFNVTFPYKEILSRLTGDVDALAREIHSANTIVLKAGSYSVYSTDGLGFRESLLKELPKLDPSRYRFVIL